MKKKKLLKTIRDITGMKSMGVKSENNETLKEVRAVSDTDVVFKITRENSVQASLPAKDSTEFQRRIFFIMSAFLKQLSTSGLVDPEELSDKAIREGLLASGLSHEHEDLDDEGNEVQQNDKKKYQ